MTMTGSRVAAVGGFKAARFDDVRRRGGRSALVVGRAAGHNRRHQIDPEGRAPEARHGGPE